MRQERYLDFSCVLQIGAAISDNRDMIFRSRLDRVALSSLSREIPATVSIHLLFVSGLQQLLLIGPQSFIQLQFHNEILTRDASKQQFKLDSRTWTFPCPIPNAGLFYGVFSERTITCTLINIKLLKARGQVFSIIGIRVRASIRKVQVRQTPTGAGLRQQKCARIDCCGFFSRD